jgi:hypothetical protein
MRHRCRNPTERSVEVSLLPFFLLIRCLCQRKKRFAFVSFLLCLCDLTANCGCVHRSSCLLLLRRSLIPDLINIVTEYAFSVSEYNLSAVEFH